MPIKIPTKYIIITIFIVILTLLGTGYIIGHRKGVNASKPTINALTTEIQRQTIVINNQKIYVASVEQGIESLKQAKDNGDVTNKELRALNIKMVNENTRLMLQIDTLLKGFSDSIKIDTVVIEGKPQHVIYLPFSFEKKDNWLSLRGTFNQIGELGLSLKMDASLDVWTGIDSKNKLPIAKITSNNPYLGVLSISSIKLDIPKPKKFNISVFAGYGACKTGLSPLVGVGVGLKIFQF
jgi:hypothetical protein